jgi:hypothetical protein
MKPGELPTNWDQGKKNIVIFNTSEFEFAAIDDSRMAGLYPSQLQGILRIKSSLIGHLSEYHVYLRMHPHLRIASHNENQPFYDLEGENLTVIPPESSVNSYALIIHCDCVVTFGATPGIEATFWGKPSILAGPSLYQGLNVTYNPASHEELMELLLKDDLKPKPRLGALIYGYYWNRFGIPYKYVKHKAIKELESFKGRELKPSWIINFRIKMLESIKLAKISLYQLISGIPGLFGLYKLLRSRIN